MIMGWFGFCKGDDSVTVADRGPFIISSPIDKAAAAYRPGIEVLQHERLKEKELIYFTWERKYKEYKGRGNYIMKLSALTLYSFDVDDMMAACLGAAFMRHGLGHFLGIDTHDPGSYLKSFTELRMEHMNNPWKDKEKIYKFVRDKPMPILSFGGSF